MTHDIDGLTIQPEGNVLFVVWRGVPSLTGARALAARSLELARAHPRGIAHFNLVVRTSSTRTLPDDVRGAILSVLNDPAQRMIASVTVFGGGGFLAATIRGVLAGLTMVARTRAPVRFVATVAEGESALLAALEGARAEVPEPGWITKHAEALMAEASRNGESF